MEVGTLDVNEKPVEEFEGVVYVEGSWAPDQHNKFPELNGISGILTGDKLALVKLGAQKSPLGQVELSIHLTERLLLTLVGDLPSATPFAISLTKIYVNT